MSFFHEGTFVHYICYQPDESNGVQIKFLVVADQSVERKSAFRLLLNIQNAFKLLIEGNGSLQILTESQRTEVEQELERLTMLAENGEQDSLGALERELDQVKHIMISNVERLLERGERINLLVSKTDRMNANSVAFRKVSARTRSKFWWDNVKYSMLLVIAIIVVIYILLGKLDYLQHEKHANGIKPN